MSVLLLRLSGPMQSWGVQSRFTVRDTGLEPSKSGVIGLLCAALGRPRQEPLDDLASLIMGVRVDQEGVLARDFHTAGKGGMLRASGQVEREKLVVSTRYYLADARFLVGLEGQDLTLLTQLHAALHDPHWPLYLGRKAFLPGEPVWLADGLREDGALLQALQASPWLGRDPRKRPEQVRLVLDDPSGSETRPDVPLSFADRRFAPRQVRTMFVPAPPVLQEIEPCTFLD
jgi:CRISPR system Cascade subunit CasD